MNYSSKRNLAALGISLAAAFVFISVLTVFTGGTPSGDMLIGETSSGVYPFTLHNLMHLFFFVGLGQLTRKGFFSECQDFFLRMKAQFSIMIQR